MPGPAYKTRALVLRKTKLREKDLIITFVDEDGSLVRAVAKGARRPGGSLAARLELFTMVDVMLARGRTLDVVTDARIVEGSARSGLQVEQAAACSCVAELIALVAQEGLEQDILFRMGGAAFDALGQAESEAALALTAAALLKLICVAGFTPRFDACLACGAPLDSTRFGEVAFSVLEGGCVCPACARPADAVALGAITRDWCAYLMRSRFGDISSCGMGQNDAFSVLELERRWIKVHFGKTLKSLEFLFSSGLF